MSAAASRSADGTPSSIPPSRQAAEVWLCPQAEEVAPLVKHGGCRIPSANVGGGERLLGDEPVGPPAPERAQRVEQAGLHRRGARAPVVSQEFKGGQRNALSIPRTPETQQATCLPPSEWTEQATVGLRLEVDGDVDDHRHRHALHAGGRVLPLLDGVERGFIEQRNALHHSPVRHFAVRPDG